MRTGIVARVEPREFLKLLMKRKGFNTTSLAAATDDKSKQPQIYRFVHGETKEPKRSTLEPVARVLGVPVDAFFDKAVMREQLRIMEQQGEGLGDGLSLSISEEPQAPPPPAVVLEWLGLLLASIPAERRGAFADSLAGFARDGGADFYRGALLALLNSEHGKQDPRAA